jgi:hypothetical protein
MTTPSAWIVVDERAIGDRRGRDWWDAHLSTRFGPRVTVLEVSSRGDRVRISYESPDAARRWAMFMVAVGIPRRALTIGGERA